MVSKPVKAMTGIVDPAMAGRLVRLTTVTPYKIKFHIF